MISVCVATYNGASSIIRQLDSIIFQLHTEDEIIVSDDNSTDNTCDLIRALNDFRIKIVYNTGAKGPVGNFQNALKYAKGEYILLADQDDVWLPNKVVDMCTALNDCDLVLTDCEIVNKQLITTNSSFFSLRKSSPGFWQNLYKNSYIGCCMGFKKEILMYVLPFPASIHMHDWWIGLLVELFGSVKFLQNPSIKYVRHGNNFSPTGEKSSNSYYKQAQNRLVILWCIFVRSFTHILIKYS